jgi:hypothetical protein
LDEHELVHPTLDTFSEEQEELNQLGSGGQNQEKEEEGDGGGKPQQEEDRVAPMVMVKSSGGTNVSRKEGRSRAAEVVPLPLRTSQSQIKTSGVTEPIIPATTSTTASSPMKMVAHSLPSGQDRPRLATGQRRRNVSAIFSRLLEARRDYGILSLSGVLINPILPWTRRQKSPWVRPAYSPV